MSGTPRDDDAVTPGAAPGAAAPLARIVRGEALRVDALERIAPDPARIAAGWERRFVIEAARSPDLVALYEATGFEVACDPVAPELLADECTDCKLVSALQYVQIYVRRR